MRNAGEVVARKVCFVSGSTVDELIDRFRAWAERAPDVQALAIVGSRARAQDPADEWSDVDVVIVADDPARYLANSEWLADIGRCRLTFVQESPFAGLYERRAHFDGGTVFDLVVIAPDVMGLAADLPATADLISRGWRALVDKQGLAARFVDLIGRSATSRARTPPGSADLADATARFWHACIWTARKVCRGELWVATVAVNCGLHESLLQVLEWEAETRPGGGDRDVWFRGRFLERWADPAAVRLLGETFTSYDRDSAAHSLRILARLYSDLITQIARRVGCSPPRDIENYGTETVESILCDFA